MKVRAPIVMLAFIAACAPKNQLPGGQNGGSQSIVSSITGIDKDLQSSEDLTYILSCQTEANKGEVLTEDDIKAKYTIKAAEAEAHAGYVKFDIEEDNPVATGDYCAIDVKGDGDYGDAKYVFEEGYPDLFYASTKPQVKEGRILEVTIYPTYEDPSAPTLEILAELNFPEKEEREGTYKVLLECDDGKSFRNRADLVVKEEVKLDSKLHIKTDSIPTDGLLCSKVVVADKESQEEKFIAFVDVFVKPDSKDVKFAATLGLAEDLLKVKVKEADEQCANFDVETRSCPGDGDEETAGIPAPGVESAPGFESEQMVLVCKNGDEEGRPFYDTEAILFFEGEGDEITYRVAYDNKEGRQVATPAMRALTDANEIKFAFDAPEGGAKYWAYVTVQQEGDETTARLRLEVKPDDGDLIPEYWVSNSCKVSNEDALKKIEEKFGL